MVGHVKYVTIITLIEKLLSNILILDRQIGTTIKFKLLQKFVDFQKGLVQDCNLYEKLAEIPVLFNHFYGDDTETYTVYMTPGVLLT